MHIYIYKYRNIDIYIYIYMGFYSVYACTHSNIILCIYRKSHSQLNLSNEIDGGDETSVRRQKASEMNSAKIRNQSSG